MAGDSWLAPISAGELSAEERRAWLQGLRILQRGIDKLGYTSRALVTDELVECLEAGEVVRLSWEDRNSGERKIAVDIGD